MRCMRMINEQGLEMTFDVFAGEMTVSEAAQELGISRRSWYNICARTV